MALSSGGNQMDGLPPPEEDFSIIPVQERLVHKNWKARLHGYTAVAKIFATTTSESDPAFKPYLGNPDLLKKIVVDSNAVSQEKGVEAIIALVKYAGENAARTREAVLPALVDKCFGSTRTGTKQGAIELALDYVEVENGGDGVVRDILPGLNAKQPKTVAGCVTALKEIVTGFGLKAVSPAPILKALPKIFGHTDKSVRAEGTLLTQSLYVYLGPAIQPALADLKPVQVKELTESFEALDKEQKGHGSTKPTRLTRAAARALAEAEMNGTAGGDDAKEEEPELDPRLAFEEKDITPLIPSEFHTLIASSKWKERKETLDELHEVISKTPRIKDSEAVSEVMKALAKRMGDANIMCVMTAANCMEGLAKGIGSGFGKYRSVAVPPMLERFKERKQNVVDAIGVALDALFATITFPDITEDILTALKSKNPQVKEGTAKFLIRCLSTTKVPPTKTDLKPLSETIVALMEDSFEPVRAAAAEALGTLMKIVGERMLNPVVDPLDDIRKAKVKDAFEKATVKCKPGVPAPPAPAKGPPKGAKSKAPPPPADDDEPPSKPVAKPPARLLNKKPAQDAPEEEAPKSPVKAAPKKPANGAAPKKPVPVAAPAAAAKPGKGQAAAAAPSESFKYKFTPEDAEALAVDLIPGQMSTDLGDANWKIRLAALDEMTTWVEGEIGNAECEVIFRFLAKKPGWNEKNFQVSAKVFAIFSILAEGSPTFSKACVALTAGNLTEKLGDIKLKKPAGDALLVFAEKTSLSFVLGQTYDPMLKQKAPKVLADSVGWVNQALTEFGIAGLMLRPLIEFLKTALKNSNAAVRTSATSTLVTLRLFAGAGIKDFLEDLNPQLLTSIQADFDKAEGTPAPVPTRFSADVVATSGGDGGSSAKGKGVGDPLDELFPRVDLEKLIGATSIVADAKNEAWKTRKEALESLQGILDVGTNKRLKGNLGDIAQVLKARLADSNKVVQMLAIDVITRIATGMNKPFEKYCRVLVLPLTNVLADQKANVRASTVAALSAIATACEGLEPMVHPIASSLEATNPLQRSSLLTWVADWMKEHPAAISLDLSPWAGPVVLCLDDRNADVRKAAQAALPAVIAHAGYDYVVNQTSSMKAASRQSVLPLILAAKPVAGAVPVQIPASTTGFKTQISTPASAATPTSAEAETVPSAPKRKIPGAATGVRSKMPSRPESRADVSEPEEVATKKPAAQGFGLKRPVASTKPAPPFTGRNADAKKARLAKDGNRWVFEALPNRKDLFDVLQHQMEPHVSTELVSLLFSHDHNAVNDHITGLGIICDCYAQTVAGLEPYNLTAEEMKATLSATSDLPLKFVSLKIHEPQPNLIAKCLDTLENVLALLSDVNYQLTEAEAMCFVPTLINKLGDGREASRVRVQHLIQSLPKIFPASRLFSFLLEHGLRSKVAKTRQGALDEMAGLFKKAGMSACDPMRAFPQIAALIGDKDAQVRKSALSTISEGYNLDGEKVWTYVGPLSPKDKTQLEERLRRVPAPSKIEPPAKVDSPKPAQLTRLTGTIGRAGSPTTASRIGGIPRPASPAVTSRTARSNSPPAVENTARPASPAASVRSQSGVPQPTSPTRKSFLPSRMAPLRARQNSVQQQETRSETPTPPETPRTLKVNGHNRQPSASSHPDEPTDDDPTLVAKDEITITISSILSSDSSRSVDALKKIQKILDVSDESSHESAQYRDLANHTEGLIETITLQMAHIFDRPDDLSEQDNYRLAKHLIQTLNAFCDHAALAESLSVDILTSLLEELTVRLLQTDESKDGKVKDLSRFINMIILRLFGTGRRINVFRALFGLLLQITKPFPQDGTSAESKEAKVAELVLKCVWKLARGIPSDLKKNALDPVELFPAIENFLQSIPPNEWRARAAAKVPCGDMPLRTIKVIIQHVVAQYPDEVYDQLSTAFDDPSATIVYPYVYRILNSVAASVAARSAPEETVPPSASEEAIRDPPPEYHPPSPPRPTSIASSSAVLDARRRAESILNRNATVNAHVSLPAPAYAASAGASEEDPDAKLIEIIGHISSGATGALHKEGITELHQFLKAYPHKKAKVDKMLDATGPQFRKYIARALASRAAEDEERGVAVAETLSRLESVRRDSIPSIPSSKSTTSPRRASLVSDPAVGNDQALSRLHDIFHYQGRSSISSNSPSHTRISSTSTQISPTSPTGTQSEVLMAQLATLKGAGS